MSTQGPVQCCCNPSLPGPDTTSDTDYYMTNGVLNFLDMVVDREVTLDFIHDSQLPSNQNPVDAPDHDIRNEDDDREEGEVREELEMAETASSESAHSERSTVSSNGWPVLLEWYVQPKPAEREVIEVTAAQLAKEYACDTVFIRSNIHNTTRVQTGRGRKTVLAPWHYTCDFKMRERKWKPSHVSILTVQLDQESAVSPPFFCWSTLLTKCRSTPTPELSSVRPNTQRWSRRLLDLLEERLRTPISTIRRNIPIAMVIAEPERCYRFDQYQARDK